MSWKLWEKRVKELEWGNKWGEVEQKKKGEGVGGGKLKISSKSFYFLKIEDNIIIRFYSPCSKFEQKFYPPFTPIKSNKYTKFIQSVI